MTYTLGLMDMDKTGRWEEKTVVDAATGQPVTVSRLQQALE